MELRICKVNEVPEEGILGVDVEGQHIILVRQAGELHALEGTCTHEYFDLAQGVLLEDRVICTLHLSSFDIKTGQVLSPPAQKSLRTYKVILRGDDVYIEV